MTPPAGNTAAERARRAQTLHETAAAQAARGRLDTAIPLWGEALGLDPDNVDVLVGLGHALGAVGEHAQATELATRACQRAPTSAAAWMLFGHLAFDGGDAVEALEAYALAKRTATGDDIATLSAARARVLLSVGKIDEAKAAIQTAGDDVTAHLLRGHIAAASGDVDAARAEFSRAGEKDPDHPEPYKQLAVLLATSDRALARELAQHALTLAPNDVEAKQLVDVLAP